MSHQIFYFLLFYTSLYVSRHHFYQMFRNSLNIICKKDFRHEFSFFNISTEHPQPFNGQNPLSVKEIFCQCFLTIYYPPAKAQIYVKLQPKLSLPNGHATSNPCRIDIDITSIRQTPNFDKFPCHFSVLFQCNFDGRKIHVVSMHLFQSNFAGRKIEIFPHSFIGVFSHVEKSTLFPHTFFDLILMAEKSTLFPCIFCNIILMFEICPLFLLTFFKIILMDKNSTSFLVSCMLMKTFEKVFPEFVTLNSLLLQECSL